MSEAGCLFGVCCGKCSHNPPRTVSMTPFTSITSQLPALRYTFYWPVWPPGVIVLAQSNAQWLHSSSVSNQPFCLPQLQEGSLITNICICGSLGPDNASHLPEVTQLLSKDLSPDLPALSQVHLAKILGTKKLLLKHFLFVYTFRAPGQNTGYWHINHSTLRMWWIPATLKSLAWS